MLEINKNIVLDGNKNPIAVQIPIEEFNRIEEIIENYGLAKLMNEVENDNRFTLKKAKSFYETLK